MMTKRLLTEAQAWREIGNRLATPDYTPVERFSALCFEAARLALEGRVEEGMRFRMVDRAVEHAMACGYSATAFKNDQTVSPAEHREFRILAAYWMALEAEHGVEP